MARARDFDRAHALSREGFQTRGHFSPAAGSPQCCPCSASGVLALRPLCLFRAARAAGGIAAFMREQPRRIWHQHQLVRLHVGGVPGRKSELLCQRDDRIRRFRPGRRDPLSMRLVERGQARLAVRCFPVFPGGVQVHIAVRNLAACAQLRRLYRRRGRGFFMTPTALRRGASSRRGRLSLCEHLLHVCAVNSYERSFRSNLRSDSDLGRLIDYGPRS